MLKFIHKKHMHKNRPEAKFVIYYSVSDIVLGFLLVVLVGFFAISYLQDHLNPSTGVYSPAIYRPRFNPAR